MQLEIFSPDATASLIGSFFHSAVASIPIFRIARIPAIYNRAFHNAASVGKILSLLQDYRVQINI